MESLNKEYNIGALLEHNGVVLEVKNATRGCDECFFRSARSLCAGNYCFSSRRDDETSVIYKEVSPESIFKFKQGDYVKADGKTYIIDRPIVTGGVKLYITTEGQEFSEHELTTWTPAFGDIVYVKVSTSKNTYVFLSSYNGNRLTDRLFSLCLNSGNFFMSDDSGFVTSDSNIAAIRPASISEKSLLLGRLIYEGLIFNGEALVDVPKINEEPKLLKVTLVSGTTYCCLASSYKIGVDGDICVNGYAYKLISGYAENNLTGYATPQEESALFSATKIKGIAEASDSDATELIDFLRENKFDFILGELGGAVEGNVALLHDGDKSKAIISVIRKVRLVNGRKMYQSASGLVYKFADKVNSLGEYKKIVK